MCTLNKKSFLKSYPSGLPYIFCDLVREGCLFAYLLIVVFATFAFIPFLLTLLGFLLFSVHLCIGACGSTLVTLMTSMGFFQQNENARLGCHCCNFTGFYGQFHVKHIFLGPSLGSPCEDSDSFSNSARDVKQVQKLITLISPSL